MSPDNPNRRRTVLGLTAETFSLCWTTCKIVARGVSRIASTLNPFSTAPIPEIQEHGRSADRDVGPPPGSETLRTLWAVSALSISFAAAVAFVFIYFTGGDNEALAITAAISVWTFGAALVISAHWLMRNQEAIEPREQLPSSAPERRALIEELRISTGQIQRRRLLTGMGVLCIGGFGAVFISLFKSFGTPPGPALLGPVWKRGQRLMTLKGTPISVNALQPGDAVMVFPEESIGSVHAQTVLIRVPPESLQLPKARKNWAPMGYVAYSRVCTHAGCPVGEFESTTYLLLCPCHQSTFDVLDGAQPTGGPAARPLPQLPLYADQDGTLRAGGDFSAPPGPGFWRMPPSP